MVAILERCVGRQVGGYLARLEDDYALIAKRLPLYAKPSAKCARYILDDNFLIFWFRFIYRYSFLIETKGYERLRGEWHKTSPDLIALSLEDM